MSKSRKITVSYLTTHELSTAEAVHAAAAIGADFISARLTVTPPGGKVYPLMSDPAEVRAARAAIQDTEVAIYDVEVARLGPDTVAAQFAPMLDIAAQLGARSLLTTAHGPDETQLADQFAQLCELAAGYGVSVDLEFLPWNSIGTLPAATRILTHASQPNAGLVVDAIHWYRADGNVADELRKLPASWFHFAQICDAPAARPASMEQIMFHAREERLNPGEGGLDLAALFAAIPRETAIAMEVPKYELSKTVPAIDRARACLEATRALLAKLD